MIQEETDNELSKTMNRMFEVAISYKITAEIALAYAPKGLFAKIVSDAETTCNEVGTSLLRDGDTVNECVTKKHSDCKGVYVHSNPDIKRKIICKCGCHTKGAPSP